ncbi:hypothetical protein N8T08_000083 [Aspergillus melleus]|uniref:Uncharacterized protein n=1 Tax=Aspergillus melleus TaxID=138277 RepID=A0ACC3BGW7_9EURO|nr:hypothetical protein N8T08_000083 [Aspergillus melleus]
MEIKASKTETNSARNPKAAATGRTAPHHQPQPSSLIPSLPQRTSNLTRSIFNLHVDNPYDTTRSRPPCRPRSRLVSSGERTRMTSPSSWRS